MSNSIDKYKVTSSSIIFEGIEINSKKLLSAVVSSNNYIHEILYKFNELNIDFLESLGQRNLSGVIGEIFKHFLVRELKEFMLNPHSDGQPDLIFLNDNEKLSYYEKCFLKIGSKTLPIKDRFSPFKYGGIEVKCTIGTHRFSSADLISRNNTPFKSNESRINYLKDFTYVSHHRKTVDLVGLYYDYYEDAGFIPQILGVFFAQIPKVDWTEMTLPKENIKTLKTSKTTSFTALLPSGKKKLKDNSIILINNSNYIKRFKDIGIKTD
jgi:hypothetical protein